MGLERQKENVLMEMCSVKVVEKLLFFFVLLFIYRNFRISRKHGSQLKCSS